MVMSYLKFRLKATDAHGIHSPFVYDLYTKAIRPQHPLASQHPSEPPPHPNLRLNLGEKRRERGGRTVPAWEAMFRNC